MHILFNGNHHVDLPAFMFIENAAAELTRREATASFMMMSNRCVYATTTKRWKSVCCCAKRRRRRRSCWIRSLHRKPSYDGTRILRILVESSRSESTDVIANTDLFWGNCSKDPLKSTTFCNRFRSKIDSPDQKIGRRAETCGSLVRNLVLYLYLVHFIYHIPSRWSIRDG